VSTHPRSPRSPLFVPRLSQVPSRLEPWQHRHQDVSVCPCTLHPWIEPEVEDKVVLLLGPCVPFNLYPVFLCLGKSTNNPL
jgi:hypothetical protein